MNKFRIYLAAAAWLLAGISLANACEPAEWLTLEQRFAKASSVFTAHITKAEETQAPLSFYGGKITLVVQATFRPVEIFKGEAPTNRILVSAAYGPGNCSIPLLPGLDYLVFLFDGSNEFMLPFGGGAITDVPDAPLDQLRKLKSGTKG